METGILKSVTHRLNMLVFATYVFFLGGFRRKMSRKTYSCGQIHQYILFSFFFCHLLQLVLWRVLHCSRALSRRFLFLKTSALQSHVRPDFPISDWIVNLCTLICSEVRNVKLVDSFVQDIRSGALTDVIRMPFNPERPQLSVDA